MRRLVSFLLLCLASLLPVRGADGAVLADRADRAYKAGEWTSAFALYSVVAEGEPGRPGPYARAMVAADMQGDSLAAIVMMENALSRGVVLDSLLTAFRGDALALGRSDIYCRTLERGAEALPYLRRPLGSALLRFYVFRSDGPNIIKYARIMLAGRPDDVPAMAALARGQLLTGDTGAACDTWQRILDIDPRNFDVLVALGTVLMDTDRPRALSLLRRALEIKPTPYLRHLVEQTEERASR